MSNAQSNGNGTEEKSSKLGAKERKPDEREDERETRKAIDTGRSGKDGRETSEVVGKNNETRPQQQTQPNKLALNLK